MWDTAEQTSRHLSHEMPCAACGHGPHTYLPCSDTCDCVPPMAPGMSDHGSGRIVELVLR